MNPELNELLLAEWFAKALWETEHFYENLKGKCKREVNVKVLSEYLYFLLTANLALSSHTQDDKTLRLIACYLSSIIRFLPKKNRAQTMERLRACFGFEYEVSAGLDDYLAELIKYQSKVDWYSLLFFWSKKELAAPKICLEREGIRRKQPL